MSKGMGWLTLILGLIVLIVPWVTSGSSLQWIETIAGIIVGIVGITMLSGK
ncbi:hypothetical protein K8R47_03575 [archaeon]|nr:hypothetical protein [archaeon]